MTCFEAESHVSTLYDGEQVQLEAANHIGDCPTCRELLRSYSEIGAEIRLMASRAAPVSVISPELLENLRKQRRSRLAFLRERVFIPRFALAAIILAVLTAIPASWTLMRAQTKTLWFQFELHPKSPGGGSVSVVKAGYDDQMGWMFALDGPVLKAKSGQVLSGLVSAHIAVKSVEDGRVELEIAARNFGPGTMFPENMQQEVAKLKMQRITYTPNETLEIPVEGGGVLTLHGEVLDHQPRIAWGFPLEPRPDQLIVRSPLLLEGDRVLANMQGASTEAAGDQEAVFLHSPGVGRFKFALREFPGAVQGQATWGYITFRLGGKSYMLAAGSPITGGDQPHTVWVALDPTTMQNEALGAGPLKDLIPGPA